MPNTTSITIIELGNNIDSMWIFIASFLVFFMQPGFALLEAGH